MKTDGILERLAEVIESRKGADPGSSYVSKLFAAGEDAVLKKIGEEATETVMAGKDADRRRIVAECADLWFHCLVMLAWMNRESLALSVSTGEAVYWSRSRSKLWKKGEESGHVQRIRALRLDCDEDAILMEIEQVGGIACHTGRQSCFYRTLQADDWVATEPVLRDPKDIYRK